MVTSHCWLLPEADYYEAPSFKEANMRWQVEEGQADFDPDFLRHTFPKLDWPALRGAAEALGSFSYSSHYVTQLKVSFCGITSRTLQLNFEAQHHIIDLGSHEHGRMHVSH